MINIITASTGNNLNLANQIAEILKGLEVEYRVTSLVDYQLPLYTPTEHKNGIPAKALELTNEFKASTSFVMIAPEYNGTLPPVLNNAISWISVSGDDDWRSAFNGKFGLIATYSGGPGLKVQLAMKQMFEHLGLNTMARTISNHGGKEFNEKTTTALLKKLIAVSS